MSSGSSAADAGVGPLLRACARAPGADSEQLRSLSAAIRDWPAFIQLADWHGLIPLVSRRLALTGGEVVPPAAATALRDRAHAIAWRALSQTAEMLAIVEALLARGIRVVPFKGPSLAMLAYGDLAARQFGDLDFLVASSDIAAARRILA